MLRDKVKAFVTSAAVKKIVLGAVVAAVTQIAAELAKNPDMTAYKDALSLLAGALASLVNPTAKSEGQ